MNGRIGGYEWGYTCPECEEFSSLSGMLAEPTLVNDSDRAGRIRALEPGDTVECPHCGDTRVFELEAADGED